MSLQIYYVLKKLKSNWRNAIQRHTILMEICVFYYVYSTELIVHMRWCIHTCSPTGRLPCCSAVPQVACMPLVLSSLLCLSCEILRVEWQPYWQLLQWLPLKNKEKHNNWQLTTPICQPHTEVLFPTSASIAVSMRALSIFELNTHAADTSTQLSHDAVWASYTCQISTTLMFYITQPVITMHLAAHQSLN